MTRYAERVFVLFEQFKQGLFAQKVFAILREKVLQCWKSFKKKAEDARENRMCTMFFVMRRVVLPKQSSSFKERHGRETWARGGARGMGGREEGDCRESRFRRSHFVQYAWER